ncbi:helix-turn-helix domain-containing protein [Aureivirga marina]|uniref:helix-turn-helix domain-containing protein n=1 Tax=Aureivirga marina TaxID=1182451 RepID=UPI0018C8FF0E|nr:helix-turn-helix domain-containing protein [Aureivirga marina]
MSEIKTYSHINDFLSELGVPILRHSDFYIVKFEEHQANLQNPKTSYTHSYFEIAFSIGYDANVSIGNQKVNAIDTNFSFVSPGQIVKWEVNHLKKESSAFLILLKPEFLPFSPSIFNVYENFPFFNHHTLSSYQINENQQQIFLDFFEKINEEYKRNEKDSLEIIRSYLNILLFNAKRELKFEQNISFLKNRSQEITYKFEQLIKQTKLKRKPIAFYARKLNISSIYLAECIKKTIQKTPKQVIDEYIVLEAKSHLSQSLLSVSEIAYLLGFEDTSYFIKYFKAHSGITPSNFRKNN